MIKIGHHTLCSFFMLLFKKHLSYDSMLDGFNPGTYQCRLLITFENRSDPDQVRQNVRPDLDPNCLTLCL